MLFNDLGVYRKVYLIGLNNQIAHLNYIVKIVFNIFPHELHKYVHLY